MERDKAQKREERIAGRLAAHLKGTAQGFEHETGTRIGTWQTRKERRSSLMGCTQSMTRGPNALHYITPHPTPPHPTTETLRALEEAVRAPGPQLEEADAAVQGHIKGELRGERIRITCMPYVD